MKNKIIIVIGAVLLANTSAYAINEKYRQQLEDSGCTQASEVQGCDITKTKEENAKAGFVSSTLAENATAIKKQKGRCTLTNGGIVDIQGPCEYFQTGSYVNVQGKAKENGVTFLAAIDHSKNQGLLIGAGTFDLAKGKLSKNDPLEFSWPNGYVLTIKPE
jgi:hypothetical protein